MQCRFWPRGGVPGILHHYTETLVAFEYTSTAAAQQPHSILFVGGLGDGLATTSYTADLVRSLQSTKWSLFTLNLSSSNSQWGLGHLDRDTDEIAMCAQYIKNYKTAKYGSNNKLVIMGHSTGSQCVLHYLYRPNPHTFTAPFDPDLEHVNRPELDGAIMQAPVSDREAIQLVLRDGFGGKPADQIKESWSKAEAFARDVAAHKDQSIDTIIPLHLTAPIYSNVPISCRRFLSLASPESPDKPGADDLFSSDLSDSQLSITFGMVRQRGLLRSKLMVLISGKDQAVPEWVNKEQILSRWKQAADGASSGQIWDDVHSGVIPGASHALSDPDQAEPRQWLCKRVLSYLNTVDPEQPEYS